MQYDVNVGSIYAIYKKKENINFEFDCKKRKRDGFIYVLGGKGFFENAYFKEEIKENTILILSKDDTYNVKALTDDFEYITTAMRFQPANWQKALGLPHLLHLDKQSYIGKQVLKLYDTWESRPTLYTMRSRIITEQILINLHEECSRLTSKKSDARLDPAIDYITQNYDKPISSLELAELCNLSISHFRRIFKENYGISPMQYRENIRIYWAKQFLKSDLLTVSEISSKLGYYDIYHFSKEFKKIVKKSPLEYKKEKV